MITRKLVGFKEGSFEADAGNEIKFLEVTITGEKGEQSFKAYKNDVKVPIMKLSPGDDITFSYEKSGNGYKITEVKESGSRIGYMEGKKKEESSSPPIVSNVLAAAVGSNGVIQAALVAGVINTKDEVLTWARAIGNIAWEMSRGPSYVTVDAAPDKSDKEPIPAPGPKDAEIPF